VRNPALALLAVHDKLLTAKRLAAAGIPHPRTGWVTSPDDEFPVSPPLVVQPRFGSWGTDVFRCADEQEARGLLHGLAGRGWFRRHGALVQELVPSMSRDLRVLVAAGEVIGGVERVAAPGEWRTNVSLGGSRLPVVPDRAAAELSVLTAATLGCHLVGVDLLEARPGGYVVLELNGAVDFDETYSLPGRDVFTDALRALALEAGPRRGHEAVRDALGDA
jgi:[lysine-biosynthesis-protein LysW]--L-2-aminoadipate ligase